MKSWSYYDRETGLFSRKKHSGPEYWRPSPPDGHVAIEGDFDHLSKRFDIETQTVVDHQPPRPDGEHEWDTVTDPTRPRWRKRRDVIEREQRRTATLAHIRELESKQHRRVRELLEDSDPQLKALSQQIAALRAELSTPPELDESSESVQPAAGSPRGA